jgi:hypothetical protein
LLAAIVACLPILKGGNQRAAYVERRPGIMTRQLLLITCALTLSVMGIAGTKSYDVTFEKPTKAGATELRAGTYGVKLVDGQAVFTRETSGSEVAPMDETGYGKSISVPVTVKHAGKKFTDTSVATSNNEGTANIQEIDLGGTDTKLLFGK